MERKKNEDAAAKDYSELVDLYLYDPAITVIQAGEYFNAPKLKTVHLGPQVKVVQQGAFSSCPQLESVEYDNPSTVFEKYVFNNTASLKHIRCRDTSLYLCYIPTDRIYFVGVLQEQHMKICLYKGQFCKDDMLLLNEPLKKDVYYVASITKDGKEYTWFDEDPNFAIIAAKFKASGESFHEYFGITLSLDTPVSWPQLQLLLGVCSKGYFLWELLTPTVGYQPTDSLPLKDIIKAMGDSFPMVTQRIMDMIKNQYIPFHWLDYGDHYSSTLFSKQLIAFLQKYKDYFLSLKDSKAALVGYLRRREHIE